MLKGLASANTPVSKIMTPQESLAVLTPQHSVLEAMDLMVKYNVRHVPVVSHHVMLRYVMCSHTRFITSLTCYICMLPAA
jgi:signal-transduction protein with cAMP-binding, CBS, and nucleotidyltransferase domain